MSLRALVLWAAGLAAAAWILSLCLFTVDQTEQALVVRLGDPVATVRDPGLHGKVPFVDMVVFYDRRLLPLEPPVDQVILGDQKRIEVETFSRFRISDPLRFYQSVRTEDQARINLAQIVSSTLRKQLGKVALPVLLTEGRDKLTASIRDEVAPEAQALGVEVADVRIRRADLPAETSQAIYDRMTSERVREAKDLRAQGFEWGQDIRSKADRDRTVLLSEAQRDAETRRGAADAEASRILASAYGRDVAFFDLSRTLEVYRRGLAGGTATLVLSPRDHVMKLFESGPPTGEAPPEQAAGARP